MSSSQIQLESVAQFPPLDRAPEESSWYAVHTMARHEKRVAAQFEEKRVCTFLPLLRQIHKWSDRRSKVEVPMFSCYAFVRIAQTTEERLKVLRTPGVLGFVGSERQGTPIPDEQIGGLFLRIAINFWRNSFFPRMSQSTLQRSGGAWSRLLRRTRRTGSRESDSDAERWTKP